MRKGKLIEFRAGLFGINPPNNLGIVTARRSRRKETFLDVFTTKGLREIKANHVTKRKFVEQIVIPGNLTGKALTRELQPRLDHLIEKYGRKGLESIKKGTSDMKELTTDLRAPSSERELWDWYRKTCPDEVLSSKEIAVKWFKSKSTSENIKTIEDVLNSSIPPGVGYFKAIGAKPRRWRPLSLDDYERITQDIAQLRALRARIIEVEEVEDEEGFTKSLNIPVALYVLGLTEDEQNTLLNCQRWMEQLVLNKEFEDAPNLLGRTPIHTIGKFNLASFLQFLAEDWTETRYLLQSASAMTEFLLRTEYWTESQALECIAIRVVKETSFTWEIEEEAEKQAIQFPEPTEEYEEWQKRTDLRDLVAYTVDPTSARDFDQALSYERHADGAYTLWVHIADVTHYVTPDSFLDRHAQQRATSVYLPPRGLPMHPPALSTGLCALQEKVPRFAVTVKLEFSVEGERIAYEIFESIVQVKANLDYNYVDEQLAAKDPYWIGLLELGDLLRERFKGLGIETKEARMTTAKPKLSLEVEEATPSMQMNEMFMVATNEVVAEFLRDSGLPALYRCHPIPDQPDIDRFNDQLAALGIDYQVERPEWPKDLSSEEETGTKALSEKTDVLGLLQKGGKLQLGFGMAFSKSEPDTDYSDETVKEEEPKRKILMPGLAQLPETEREKWMKPFQEVLEQINLVEDKTERAVMHMTTLGMFGRAFYTAQNIGHFGLGSTCYTHFTAPIRRYSDDVVHRMVKGLLHGSATAETPVYTEEELDELADHCTDQTIAADKLERKIVGAGLAFMTRRSEWQGVFSGVVVRVLPHALFLTLREIIDGKLRMSDYTRDEVIVDPSESIAFRKKKEGTMLRKILHAEDWREMLDDEDEPIEILVRLGQKIPVRIAARDYIEGNVSVVPATFST